MTEDYKFTGEGSEIDLVVVYEYDPGQKETRDDPPFKPFVDIKEVRHKGEDIMELLLDHVYEDIERHIERINGIED